MNTGDMYLIGYTGQGERHNREWYVYHATTKIKCKDRLTLKQAREKALEMNSKLLAKYTV